MIESLGIAREAVAEKRWRDAFDSYDAVDVAEMAVADLTDFALAAQLIGRDEMAATVWERAHLTQLDEGDLVGAVNSAFWLAFGLMNAGYMAKAGGWFGRAQRLVDEHGLDCAEKGLLLAPVGLRSLEGGDPETAMGVFGEMLDIGNRFANPDLVALSRMAQGRGHVIMGHVDSGVALLDEAMVSVMADEVSPMIAGRIYCAVVLVCHQAFDIDRVREWTAALGDWCDAQQDIVPFRGQCLIHRSEIRQWQGDWSAAIVEAERACAHLSDPLGQPAFGMAFYQLGELHRLQGRFDEAMASYQEASQHGKSPVPGIPLLRFAQGDTEAAAVAIRRALEERSDRSTRAQVLVAAVDILAATGDTEPASEAAAELSDLAIQIGAPVLSAMAIRAKAVVALASEPARALDHARDAADAWARLDSPYDHAKTREIAGAACMLLGDPDSARFWIDPALVTYEGLGAEPDLKRLRAAFTSSGSTEDHALTERQIEVLTAVASGKTNRQIAEELYVSEHTVRRHLQNIFNKIGVTSRAAATAYAYEQGLL